MISIVIPVFNREELILSTIQNLLYQTFTDFEIVIVDDFSTDDTYDLVQELSRKENRVRCFRTPVNMGAQAARNIGIRKAEGSWISFQDSDEIWLQEKLQLQYNELERVNFNPMTVVHGDCTIYYHSSGEKHRWELPLTEGKTAFIQLFSQSSVLFPTILTSKKALEKIGFLDENIPSYQEWDTAIRLSKICNYIHIREPLLIYNIHSGHTISKSGEPSFRGYKYVVDKFMEEIIDCHGTVGWNRHIDTLLHMGIDVGLWEDVKFIVSQLEFSKTGEAILCLKKIFYKLLDKKWEHTGYLLKWLDDINDLTLAQRVIKQWLRIYYKLHLSPRFVFYFWSRIFRKK